MRYVYPPLSMVQLLQFSKVGRTLRPNLFDGKPPAAAVHLNSTFRRLSSGTGSTHARETTNRNRLFFSSHFTRKFGHSILSFSSRKAKSNLPIQNNFVLPISARSMSTSLVAPLELVTDLKSSNFDAIVVVAPSIDQVEDADLKQELMPFKEIDKKADTNVILAPTKLPAKRIVFSGTGPLDNDFDTVSSYADAASKGITKAISCGSKSPLIVISQADVTRFSHLETVALLGAFKSTYVPLEMRESVKERAQKVEKLGLLTNGKSDEVALRVKAFEQGRAVCRDIGGSDPERMASPRVEEYVRNAFTNTDVKVEVIKGQETFEKEYPCLAAVNRGASVIPRHDGRVIWLTYEGEGEVLKTFYLIGKGVTYDTGGADIKTGGSMPGMSRDKCGAASVAGILKTLSILKPKGIKVVGVMGMIRNSCGENCYVADEIVTSRAGVRLRVQNTDAEGRMVMADLLCQAKEMALNAINPHLMTIATLTGHVKRSYGKYSAVMDNGPAKKEGFARSLQDIGDDLGDMFEISSLRKEDFEVNKDLSGEFVDIMQLPSGRDVPRGHQYAAGFLQMASGLDKHMLSSKTEKPLKYSHLDIAGSSGNLPNITTASTVVALVSKMLE